MPTETIRGDLQADIERARAELALRRPRASPAASRFASAASAANGEATADDGDCGCHNRGWDEGYNVEYDIELRVPRGATLDLATVNDGDVTAEGVSGDFTVANVNGGVRLTGLVGSGSIKTVNGDIEATFERAPAEATSFRTVNGKLDVTFPDESLGRSSSSRRCRATSSPISKSRR